MKNILEKANLYEQLRQQTIEKEQTDGAVAAADPNRLKLHLMPKVGWLNDPNGLCQFRGIYHVFFQYSPLDAAGGMKCWGHFTSKDLLSWTREETTLFPDQDFDRDGVYSGSACIADDKMYLYYTGNVKQEGAHDFVSSGREANTVLVESADGIHFSPKELLMTNQDYPSDYTCHIRDPKVWKEGDTFYMVQGGRKKNDQGAILLFSGKNPREWKLEKEITTSQTFGYMWECPDYFFLDGAVVLSCSPQGLASRKYQYQNIYQSGYFLLEEDITGNITDKNQQNAEIQKTLTCKELCKTENFFEWDMGFDFYAPQTFLDESGRRLLIGWAGIPDAVYDNGPTVKKGWQHALTLPRELSYKNGRIYQNPVAEIKELRRGRFLFPNEESRNAGTDFFELEIDTELGKNCEVEIYNKEDAVRIIYEYGVLKLQLTKQAGRGRTTRQMKLPILSHLRMIVDTSLIEIYVNHGEDVFTSRFYFADTERRVRTTGTKSNVLWILNCMGIA